MVANLHLERRRDCESGPNSFKRRQLAVDIGQRLFENSPAGRVRRDLELAKEVGSREQQPLALPVPFLLIR